MALVSRIENKSNVNFRYMGVDCWPVVRNTFMSMVSHGVVKPSKKLSLTAYLHALFDFIYCLLRVESAYAIVLTDFKYQVEVHSQHYFKDASVIKELIYKTGKKCHILTQSFSAMGECKGQTRSIFFLTILAAVLSRLLMKLDSRKLLPNYLQGIYSSDELEGLDFDSDSNAKQVQKNIYFVIVASFLFKLILRRVRPTKCFIVCYYSCLGMALCVACRKLGIESIDLQHGVSGSNMRAYGQWNKLPADGLNTLPQSFYCWTPMDVSAIESWSADSTYHRAFLTGNIWHQYQAEKDHLRLTEELALAKEVTGYRKIVLYTAQTQELPKLILRILKQAPRDYFFIIRMHPDTPVQQLTGLSEKLKLINNSCSVINATRSRIHIVIQLADLHITEWSAAVYDAYFEGLGSLVVSRVGEDYFEDFIKLGVVRCCYNADDILDLPSIENPGRMDKWCGIQLTEISALIID